MTEREFNNPTIETSNSNENNNLSKVNEKENESWLVELKQNVIDYFKQSNQNLTSDQIKQFWALCKMYKLNPLKREIYGYTFGGKLTTVVGYQVYVKKAEATGLLDYNEFEIKRDEQNNIVSGTFIGKRKDRSKEFRMEFIFNEWKPQFKNSLWETKPLFMFQKVMYANGMRWLFPNELADLPYIQEELWYHNQQHQEDIKQNAILEENYDH